MCNLKPVTFALKNPSLYIYTYIPPFLLIYYFFILYKGYKGYKGVEPLYHKGSRA